MNKQDFHTALLCIALIAAGVTGYQLVNGEIESPGESTFKINFDDLANRSTSEPKINIPPPFFNTAKELQNQAKTIELNFPPEKSSTELHDSLDISIQKRSNADEQKAKKLRPVSLNLIQN